MLHWQWLTAVSRYYKLSIILSNSIQA